MSLDRRHLLSAARVFALGVLLAAPVHAQTRPGTAPAKPAAAAKSAAPATTGALTGSISGKVMNGKDGVAYAHVMILGTTLGASSDESGSFVIRPVPVGPQQVKVMALGFEAQVQTVQVNAGVNSNVTFVVGESRPVKQVDEIVVTAEKRIDTKSSTTKQNITAEKLREIPVDNLSQAIATKAGIVAEGFLKGTKYENTNRSAHGKDGKDEFKNPN